MNVRAEITTAGSDFALQPARGPVKILTDTQSSEVQRHSLKPDNQVQLGSIRFTFRLAEESLREALSNKTY